VSSIWVSLVQFFICQILMGDYGWSVRPGVGKTTVIREIARVLADEVRKRVVSCIVQSDPSVFCWSRDCSVQQYDPF
jgi:Mg-chelatase subunit ChlI